MTFYELEIRAAWIKTLRSASVSIPLHAAYCISRTGLDWTGLVKRGLVKRGLVKRGLVKRGLVKRGLVKRGLVKRGLVKRGLRIGSCERPFFFLDFFRVCKSFKTER